MLFWPAVFPEAEGRPPWLSVSGKPIEFILIYQASTETLHWVHSSVPTYKKHSEVGVMVTVNSLFNLSETRKVIIGTWAGGGG